MKMELIAAANNKFGLDLFKLLCTEGKGNTFLSPFSISVALAMTQLGAREKTAKDMTKALRWETEDETKLHQQFNAYITKLQAVSEGYQLTTANRIYLEKKFAVLEEFKSKTNDWYLAEPINADFIGNSEGERVNINTWVSQQTQDKIRDLLAPGILNADTRMVLVNAIYFKGKWEKQFDERQTFPNPFKVAPGQTKEVQLMSITSKYTYVHDQALKCQAVEIPYKGGDLSMVIILPEDDFGLQQLVKDLTFENLTAMLGNMGHKVEVHLSLPRFEITSSFQLKPPLSALGMAEAFDMRRADFSGMTGIQDLYLSEVVHKAFVQVNEEGTEAAAATAAVMMMRCAALKPKPVVKVDHPFLFAILDKQADGSLLFLGQVYEP